MTTHHLPTDHNPRKRWLIYTVTAVLVVALLIIMLAVFRSAKSTRVASDKADKLISAINAAGYTAPTKDQITRTLGDDGGPVCDDPAGALARGTLKAGLYANSTSPGGRPIVASKKVVAGEALVIEIYCPDKSEEFADLIGDLKFADVIKG